MRCGVLEEDVERHGLRLGARGGRRPGSSTLDLVAGLQTWCRP